MRHPSFLETTVIQYRVPGVSPLSTHSNCLEALSCCWHRVCIDCVPPESVILNSFSLESCAPESSAPESSATESTSPESSSTESTALKCAGLVIREKSQALPLELIWTTRECGLKLISVKFAEQWGLRVSGVEGGLGVLEGLGVGGNQVEVYTGELMLCAGDVVSGAMMVLDMASVVAMMVDVEDVDKPVAEVMDSMEVAVEGWVLMDTVGGDVVELAVVQRPTDGWGWTLEMSNVGGGRK